MLTLKSCPYSELNVNNMHTRGRTVVGPRAGAERGAWWRAHAGQAAGVAQACETARHGTVQTDRLAAGPVEPLRAAQLATAVMLQQPFLVAAAPCAVQRQ